MKTYPFGLSAAAIGSALLLFMLLGSWYITSISVATVTIGVFVAFAIPGVLLFTGPGWLTWLPFNLVIGSCASIAVVTVVNAIMIRWLGWDLGLWLTIVFVIAASVCSLAFRSRITDVSLLPDDCRFSREDWSMLALVLVLLLGLILIPLARLGEVQDGTLAFHGLLAHDFLWRAVHSQAVANGLPAMDMFMASEPMENYLFYYSIIAFAIRMSDGNELPMEFIAVSDVILPFLFVPALMLVMRAYGASGRTAWLGVMLGIFCYSYNGIYVLAKYTIIERYAWISSIAGGYSDYSFGWYRDLLVEPHATLAVLMAFSALLIHRSIEQNGHSVFRHALLALFLLASFASDSFVGVLMCFWYAIVVGIKVVRAPGTEIRKQWLGVVVTGALFAILLGVSLVVGLCSIGTSSGSLTIRPFPTAWKFGLFLYPLVLGPGLIFSAWFAYRWLRFEGVRKQYPELISIFLLLLVALFASLMVMHTFPENDAVVFRKSIKLLQVPVFLFGAFGIMDACRTIASQFKPRAQFRRFGLLIALPIALSLSTLWADLSAWAGFHDSGQTSHISQAEINANQWIRKNTPAGTVVQSLPEHPAPTYALSPVAMFAGRPMALGNLKQARLSAQSPGALDSLLHDIRTLFRTEDPQLAAEICLRRKIEIIYVGPHEKYFAPKGMSKFYSENGPFTRIFSNGVVDLFRLRQEVQSTSASWNSRARRLDIHQT